MAVHYTLTMELPSDNGALADIRNRFDLSQKRMVLRAVVKALLSLIGGTSRAYVRGNVASACATGTYTCVVASVVDDTDVVTIGGTALSVKASPSSTAEFAKGSTNAGCATNLANAINANATLAKIVRATASSDVVTVTALAPGPVGNFITLAETGNGFTKSGTTLANGASDEVDGYAFGYTPST